MNPPPLLTLGCVAAALIAGLGALPFSTHNERRPRLVGLADALAAGLMLGSGYLLIRGALAVSELLAMAGAATGVLYTAWAQRATRSPARSSDTRGALTRQALHSASEGVAIGVAAAFDLRLGTFVLAALALHNVAEGVALSSILTERGFSRARAAGFCIAVKSAQPLLALTTFALLASPGPSTRLVAFALGFAAGALVILVFTELLPESYALAGHRAIATLVTVATGAVLFLEDFFR